MLRIRINIFLAMVLVSGIGACAPRDTPAPVYVGGAGAADFAYPAGAGGRGSVIVQPGDTLYAISRYHKTALQALVEANDLAPPFVIKPGQVLRLPEAQTQPPLTPAPVSSPQQIFARTSSGTGKGEQRAVVQHTVPPLDGSARLAGTAGNKNTRSDTPLNVSATIEAGEETGLDAGEDQTSGFAMADERIPPQPKPTPVRSQIEPQRKTARLVTPVPTPAPATQDVRFLWPAKGPILSDFGSKPNGLHNDGINIAMPPNGPVAAAGDGVVSYAGNGLRGYGNLLLIRHDGGWTTAYAHNAELLVGKGDRVVRGQVIARAGRSGGVAQDQLHFEVRRGAKAVNPKPLLVGG